MLEAVHTCSDADHDSQVVVFPPHDDGSQDLPPKQAVLDASSEGVEALVAQHGHLIVEGTATYGELERGCRPGWLRDHKQVSEQNSSSSSS